jgi:hypothetical protein
VNRPPIIGIAGLAGTGKDTLADFIIAQYGGYKHAFAEPMRLMLRAGFGIDLSTPYWKANKENPIPALGKSPREMLQLLGTQWGRELIHPDVWVTLVHQQFLNRRAGMVLADVRMENEAAFVRKFGGTVIHIKRKAATPVTPHASEAGVSIQPEDVVIHNDLDLGSLQHAVSKLFGGDV